MTRVKICGIRTPDIAEAAVRYGADALGFVFYEKSPRNVAPGEAAKIVSGLPALVSRVGVFADKTVEEIVSVIRGTGIDTIQLHGDYPIETVVQLKNLTGLPVIYAYRMETLDEESLMEIDFGGANAVLVDKWAADAYGGTGGKLSIGRKGAETFSSLAQTRLSQRVILAGGIDASNAAELIRRYKPYAIDLSSGVEIRKGVKDAEMIREFFESIKKDRY